MAVGNDNSSTPHPSSAAAANTRVKIQKSDPEDDILLKGGIAKKPTFPGTGYDSNKSPDKISETITKGKTKSQKSKKNPRGRKQDSILTPQISPDATEEEAQDGLIKRLDKANPPLSDDADVEKFLLTTLGEWLRGQSIELGDFLGDFQGNDSMKRYHSLLHRVLTAYTATKASTRRTKFAQRHALIRYLLTNHPHLYERKRKCRKESYQNQTLPSGDPEDDDEPDEDDGEREVEDDSDEDESQDGSEDEGEGESDEDNDEAATEDELSAEKFDDEVKTALIVTLEKAIALDEKINNDIATEKQASIASFSNRDSRNDIVVQSQPPTIDPFLQLLVQTNPKETAAQIELHGQQRLLFELLSRIWPALDNSASGNIDLGLQCAIKLLPCLKPSLLRMKEINTGNTVLHLVARYSVDYPEHGRDRQAVPGECGLLKHIQDLTSKHRDAITRVNIASESPYLYRVKALRLKQHSTGSPYNTNDPISAYLKRRSIAHDPEQEALKLLYGKVLPTSRDREISVDLINLAGRSISESRLKKFLQWMKPDDVLKYVRIPPFTVRDDLDGELSDAQGGEYQNPLSPRNNCQKVFTLLQALKVVAILDVSVDDLSPNFLPYTNTAIFDSLAHYGQTIERWDWRKVDICSDAIHRAAPNVRDMYLYSSGNNAVLKSWSASDGLSRFSKLENVHVKICADHARETRETIEECVGIFKRRLQDSFMNSGKRTLTKVTVDTSSLRKSSTDTGSLASAGMHAQAQEQNQILPSNSWLSKMERFASFINDAPDPKSHKPRRIKVAILDDGFDLIDILDEFDGNKIVGEAFPRPCAEQEAFNGRFRNVAYSSEGGHGTKMAKLIRKICPKVEFYMAKLENIPREPSRDGKSKLAWGPTATSAVEAIRWAIQNKVHVISMSWTITRDTTGNGLQEALDLASREGILLFGADSDEGYNVAGTVVYPAKHPNVFCIGAADAVGNIDRLVGPEADYAFPGGDARDEVQGSSFATALAAGLAALILHCAEYINYGGSEAARDGLRIHENMDGIFRTMLAGKTKYVSVRNFVNDREGLLRKAWCDDSRRWFENMMKTVLASYSSAKGHTFD